MRQRTGGSSPSCRGFDLARVGGRVAVFMEVWALAMEGVPSSEVSRWRERLAEQRHVATDDRAPQDPEAFWEKIAAQQDVAVRPPGLRTWRRDPMLSADVESCRLEARRNAESLQPC